MREYKKNNDNVVDIAKVIWKCDKDKKELPKFVIFEPQEVPNCGDVIVSTITAKLNETCKKLDGVAEQLKSGPIAWPQPSCSTVPSQAKNLRTPLL